MLYRIPTIKDKDKLTNYFNELKDNNENYKDISDGFFSVAYIDWMNIINMRMLKGTRELGRWIEYLCFDEDELVGILQVRYELSEELRKTIGDIGYNVRPSCRKRGYATKMLAFGLKVLKECGRDEAIVGCFSDNVASRKVIENNGGEFYFQSDNFEKGKWSDYFRIKL